MEISASPSRVKDPKIAALEKRERVRDRYAERAHSLLNRYGDLLSHATTYEQRVAIEAAYQAETAQRVMHRRRSDFSDPPKHDLDRAGAHKVMTAFYLVRDKLYRRKLKGEQQIPDSRRRVLQYLLDLAVQHGRVFPSHKTIAEHARCCERTVRNCLAWLRNAGFLEWQRRLDWTVNALGQKRPKQVSNGYRLKLSGLARIAREMLNSPGNGKKFRVAENPRDKIRQLVASAVQSVGVG